MTLWKRGIWNQVQFFSLSVSHPRHSLSSLVASNSIHDPDFPDRRGINDTQPSQSKFGQLNFKVRMNCDIFAPSFLQSLRWEGENLRKGGGPFPCGSMECGKESVSRTGGGGGGRRREWSSVERGGGKRTHRNGNIIELRPGSPLSPFPPS
jgi:hypothetical protein